MPPTSSPSTTLPTRHWTSGSDAGTVLDWPLLKQEKSLVGLMNFSGDAQLIWADGQHLSVSPGQFYWLQMGVPSPICCQRLPGMPHECLVLVFPNSWLAASLRGLATTPVADLAKLLPPQTAHAHVARALRPEDRTWAQGCMAPHLCEQARKLLDVSRLTEFLLREFYPAATPEPAQNRTERLTRDRIAKAKSLLTSQLDAPLVLEQLAKSVGCSPHYLSRTFSEVEGKSLSLWLRAARITRAAQLIDSGQCNVSEAAVEVGYRSFSHFSRAFKDETGCSPSAWSRRGGAKS